MTRIVPFLAGALIAAAFLLHQAGYGVALELLSARQAFLVSAAGVERLTDDAPVEAAPVGDVRAAWATDLAQRLGNAQPSDATIAFIVAWTRAEDACLTNCGYASAFERHNPLNTTYAGYGKTAPINGDGVGGYPDDERGMQATVATLTNGLYPRTLAGILTNAPVVDDAELALWGTGAGNVTRLWEGSGQ